MKKICVIILFTICLVSCISKNEKPYQKYEITDVTDFKNMKMPDVEYFTLEKIPTPEVNGFFLVYADTILVVFNYANPDPYIISLYNIKTLEFIAGCMKKGSGPGEMISPMVKLRNNRLDVTDIQCHNITSINIDSILVTKFDYCPDIVHIDHPPMDYILKKDTLVVANPYFVNGYGVSKEVPNFLIYDSHSGIALEKNKENEEFNPFNTCSRRIFYNNKHNHYVEFWNRFPIMNIYNQNFELIKQYRGYESDEVKFGIVETMLMPIGEFSSSFFWYGCQTSKHIYIVNDQMPKYKRDTEDYTNQEIWCIDYDYNINRRLKPKDFTIPSCLMSCNDDTGNIFICAFDDEGEIGLFKLNFESK